MEKKTSRKTALPLHWISALFIKFQSRYLHKWTSAIEGIEESVVIEWSQELAGLTGAQIKTGVDNWKEAWPPSSAEFKKCCLGELSNKTLAYNKEAHKEYRTDRLLTNISAPETSKKAINKLKGILKGA